MKRFNYLIHLLFFGIFLCSLSLNAKDVKKAPSVVNSQLLHDANVDLKSKINFSRQLIREKNYEGASALLETLYEKHPDDPVIVNLLKQCYDKLQYYPKTEELIRRHLTLYPESFGYWLAYGEVLVKMGKIEEAYEKYEKAVSLIKNNNKVGQQNVIQSLINNNLDKMVLSYIKAWRNDTNDSSLFALQRGTILEKQKKYEEATFEFYNLLKDTSYLGTRAEKKILALLDFVDSSPAVEKLLLNQPDIFENVRTLKILSAHYLKTGQYEKAFRFTITQDSIEGFKGRIPVTYMRNCTERKLYPPAVRMGEYLKRRYKNIAAVADGYFTYGDVLSRLGRFDEAIIIYDTIFFTLAHPRDKAKALYKIGEIYLNKLNDFKLALTYFDSIKTHYPSGLDYLNALIATPYCYLRQGKLVAAKEHFQHLLNHRLNEDLKEEVYYSLGLILFFEKKVDSCQAAFNKLVVDYHRGFFVNDALQLLLIIDEAQGYPQVLYDYSNALLFEQRRMTDSMITGFGLIAQSESLVLADVALYKLAEINIELNDTTSALKHIDQLIERFPESYYLPYGLKKKADIFLENEEKTEHAKKIYRHLLENYPDYPFISKVRERMRELEADSGSA